jgi:NAD(P)-dependent dehydrogenase (short-subunit alcohol dehydrogenase family)
MWDAGQLMDLGLDGKVAVVTAASGGIGLSAVHALVAEGARVVAGSRTTTNLEGVDGVTAVALDLMEPDAPASLVQRAIDEHGRLDVLPSGRFTTPEEVATLVVLLASDRTSNVTGANYVIDGGLIKTT